MHIDSFVKQAINYTRVSVVSVRADVTDYNIL